MEVVKVETADDAETVYIVGKDSAPGMPDITPMVLYRISPDGRPGETVYVAVDAKPPAEAKVAKDSATDRFGENVMVVARSCCCPADDNDAEGETEAGIAHTVLD